MNNIASDRDFHLFDVIYEFGMEYFEELTQFKKLKAFETFITVE